MWKELSLLELNADKSAVEPPKKWVTLLAVGQPSWHRWENDDDGLKPTFGEQERGQPTKCLWRIP